MSDPALLDSVPRPLLSVRDLTVELRGRNGTLHPVDGVSFAVEEGETLVVLGESGSGKSLTAMALMGLLPRSIASVAAGTVEFAGVDLARLPASELRRFRGPQLAMVFQDALTALNPVQTIGAQIVEAIRIHEKMPRAEARKLAIGLLSDVGIPAPESRLGDYPHQFSGGMRQRVMIAMAIALRPRLLIADEPTTALDVTVQAQILDLLERLQAEYGMAIVLITHDLGVAEQVADRVVVMYAGKVVESGPAVETLGAPRHPYTAALLDSMPGKQVKGEDLATIGGSPPVLGALQPGCSFAPRCPRARAICRSVEPPLESVGDGRHSACHFWQELVEERA